MFSRFLMKQIKYDIEKIINIIQENDIEYKIVEIDLKRNKYKMLWRPKNKKLLNPWRNICYYNYYTLGNGIRYMEKLVEDVCTFSDIIYFKERCVENKQYFINGFEHKLKTLNEVMKKQDEYNTTLKTIY